MDVRLYVNSWKIPAVSLKGLSLRPDEKFLKVPRDVRPANWTPNKKSGILHEGTWVVFGIREFVFEIGKDWMCVCSVDIALLKQGEVGLEAASWLHVLQ